VLDNKRALELHQNLMKLLEQLAGDEHGREKLAQSVRNVVPTLTSNKRRGLSLNGRC
jgi:ABC-type cobalamin transport system ATPase subunit